MAIFLVLHNFNIVKLNSKTHSNQPFILINKIENNGKISIFVFVKLILLLLKSMMNCFKRKLMFAIIEGGQKKWEERLCK